MAVAPLTEGERLRRLIDAPIVIGPMPGSQPAAAPAPPGVFQEFGRGIASSLGQTAGGFGQVAADLPGADQGNALQQYGQDVQQRNVSGIQNFQDVLDRPGAAFGAATGNAAGSVAGMVGARTVGSVITAAGGYLAPANPVIGGAIAGLGQLISWGGPVATLFAQAYQGIRQQQIQDNPDAAGSFGAKVAAGTGGVASAAIERLGGGERLADILLRGGKEALAKDVGKEGAKQVAATTYGGALRNLVTGPVARTALYSGVTEAGEELLQNPIQQAAAFQNPLTPDSLQQTAFSATMGLLGGAGVGGAFGALTPRGKPTVDPGTVSDDDLKSTVDTSLSGQSTGPLALPAPGALPDGSKFVVGAAGQNYTETQFNQIMAQDRALRDSGRYAEANQLREQVFGVGQQDTSAPSAGNVIEGEVLPPEPVAPLALPAPPEAPLVVSSRGVVSRQIGRASCRERV